MVLEAFASGVPVVALPALGTDRPGDHWSNVIVAADESVGAFGDAIVETMRQDQGPRVARGRAIAEAFDWEKVGGRILEVFERVSRTVPSKPTGSRRQLVRTQTVW